MPQSNQRFCIRMTLHESLHCAEGLIDRVRALTRAFDDEFEQFEGGIETENALEEALIEGHSAIVHLVEHGPDKV